MAEEGVNGTISGRQNQVESLVSHLRSWPEMNDFEVKYSTSLEQNFNRMKVKIKDEIVTMGEPYIDAATDSGQYVDPKDWNQLISRDDVLIVDTRNTYEVSMGRFDGATNPSLEKFRDFPSWAAELSRDVDKSTAVAMYYAEGNVQHKGSEHNSNYLTRVMQVFVKEEGGWKIRAAHWSPLTGGKGTTETAVQ